ncbi:rod shape-determining protein RodA [Campylobacter ureolyticus]|nr:rod shape-determining protein RodA [Campylobacter ureolyticus]
MIIFDKRILAHFDFVQLLFIIPILVLSHILISEANEILAFKQYIYYALGFGVFLFFL